MHFVLLIIPIFLSFSFFNSPLGQYVGYAPGWGVLITSCLLHDDMIVLFSLSILILV
jgi:hypothetical protein